VPVRPVRLVRARVKALRNEAGLSLNSDVRVGDVMIVDLYTRRDLAFVHQGMPFIASCFQSAEDGGWVPADFVELLP